MVEGDWFEGKWIGVLMGGTSGEREVSLRSGKMVYESILRQGFRAVALDVREDAVSSIQKASFDIAFVMLHGRGGEDGTIQGVLEQLGLPYTGSRVLASALSMDKIMSKRIFCAEDITTPPYLLLERDWDVERARKEAEAGFEYPLVLKPVNEGSSLGVTIAHDRGQFEDAYRAGHGSFDGLFVERFVDGSCITVGVLGTGKAARALPVLHLIPRNEFYDYEAKYTAGMTEFICPAQIGDLATRQAQELAVRSHRALGLRGFSRVDMQLGRDGTVFVLEANSIPGMTELSDLPAEARAIGMSYDELVYEILTSAVEG